MKIKLEKISVSRILANHFKSLVDFNTKRAGLDDWVIFLIIPILVTTIILCCQGIIPEKIINLIITILSIFVGLLINLIVLIFDLATKETTPDLRRIKIQETRRQVLKETLANISYTIFLSLITIIICVFCYSETRIVTFIASALVYFLIVHFIATLLMILKRMYYLFTNEIDSIDHKA